MKVPFVNKTFALILVSLALITPALQGQNATLSVQGVLKNADGTTVPDGNTYTITFKLWDAETGGTAVWQETKSNVSILGGLYEIVLGDGATVLNAPFNKPYYLGISLGTGSGAEFVPRPRLSSAPYALSLLGQSNIFPSSGRVGIGTTAPHASAQMEVLSTSKGVLFPRMTEALRDAIASPATGLLIFQTDGASGFFYYDGTRWRSVKEYSTASLQIGDTHAGGVIFYLEPSGVNGLVAASVTSSFDSNVLPWGCSGTAIPAARGTAVGSGRANTWSILKNCTISGTAADKAVFSAVDGYGDWHLPSMGELVLMHRNLHLAGLGGFGADAYYWSSTENDATTAWRLQFTNNANATPNTAAKTDNHRVRMVRPF